MISRSNIGKDESIRTLTSYHEYHHTQIIIIILIDLHNYQNITTYLQMLQLLDNFSSATQKRIITESKWYLIKHDQLYRRNKNNSEQKVKKSRTCLETNIRTYIRDIWESKIHIIKSWKTSIGHKWERMLNNMSKAVTYVNGKEGWWKIIN